MVNVGVGPMTVIGNATYPYCPSPPGPCTASLYLVDEPMPLGMWIGMAIEPSPATVPDPTLVPPA